MGEPGSSDNGLTSDGHFEMWLDETLLVKFLDINGKGPFISKIYRLNSESPNAKDEIHQVEMWDLVNLVLVTIKLAYEFEEES